jgi:hypothetical protein
MFPAGYGHKSRCNQKPHEQHNGLAQKHLPGKRVARGVLSGGKQSSVFAQQDGDVIHAQLKRIRNTKHWLVGETDLSHASDGNNKEMVARGVEFTYL